MKNQLLARGKMFGLAFKSITRAEFKELMKNGRTGDLYEGLKEANNNEKAHYGFSLQSLTECLVYGLRDRATLQ